MHTWLIVVLAVDGAVLIAVFAQLSRIERRMARLEKAPKSKRRSTPRGN